MPFQARGATASPDPHEQELDADLQTIRAEIRALQRRKRYLASSLLSSDSIQKLMRRPSQTPTSLQEDVSPLAEAAGKHADSNHHRIAFGTTAFPFKDPSPSATPGNLLGVRIDVCTRGGRFAKPYYVLLRPEREKRLRVHRHTIPSFIDLPRLENVYLPSTGSRVEGGNRVDGAGVQKGARNQDLRGFVRELRRELAAWHLREDTVQLLREKLGLCEALLIDPVDRLTPEARGGIVALEPTSMEARYLRLEWEDGRVGRLKLSNSGIVERAVVIGDDGRDKIMEDAMTGGGGRVESLLERLRDRIGAT
ncbi:hypothetical protein N7539_009317 [Penicillium diatomitis]|uniref:Cenp-O kinetochore centromere component n=1 Tax=Penicillium diatomitis TaxID=2819901 RepID=A0A9W9WLG2_9EURO|nr:uncharacterized protein N7539_009317 [Penicillium diatomitis]KAJ5469699.1 hypothetical protein N7539_009317 [Penicillium diatomitis]